MKLVMLAPMCAVVATPFVAAAQIATPVAQLPPPIPAIATPTQAVLRAQTPVALRMAESLTTKKKAVRVGQRFNLEVAEPVMVNGIVVIPVGAPATAEVTEVRNKGMWGKSGYIGARLVHLRVGDRTIRLSGSFDDKGVTGTGGVVAAAVFLPVAGFFTTGTSAQIPAGSGVKGFIDEDVPLAMTASAPAPLTVVAPVPVMQVATPPAPVALPAAPPK